LDLEKLSAAIRRKRKEGEEDDEDDVVSAPTDSDLMPPLFLEARL
jgi:hypothetical protein